MFDNNIESIIKAQEGNEKEMEKIIEQNNGLIWSIVKRFTGRGYEVEDLYQIGCIGFIKSIQRFDTNFDVRLSTYAVPYILGEIKRHIRDDGPIKVSRSIKELNVKINEAKKQYLIKKGKEISINELSKELKVSKEDIVMAIEANRGVDSIDNVQYRDNKTDKTISIMEKISTGIDEATLVTNKLTVKNMIEDLDKRDKEIILLRYYKQKTQMQVAKILGITQVQVSRIEKKILNSMKMKLTS